MLPDNLCCYVNLIRKERDGSHVRHEHVKSTGFNGHYIDMFILGGFVDLVSGFLGILVF
jgi:hypothetical protein